MEQDRVRTIFAVASPANGSGKTSLAAALVAALPGSSAVKFTTVRKDGSRCPRSAGSCACRSLTGEYTVIEQPDVIRQPGTDTARLADAGARRVLWCLARPSAYGPLLTDLDERLRLEPGPLVIEGASVLERLPHARLIFVLRPEQPASRFKSLTFPLLERAELVVVNGPADRPVHFPWQADHPEAAARLHAELDRRDVVRTDLREPLPAELYERLGIPRSTSR